MSNTTTSEKLIEERQVQKIIVSGAGPAGLLCASHFLKRNKEQDKITYDVTLLDGREDYGSFTIEELQKNHRSWMLGLADHGMDAIKSIPELYENYVKGQGIRVTQFDIYLGKKCISSTVDDVDNSKIKGVSDEKTGVPPEGYIVDRNFIVASLARYLKETHSDDENYHAMYQNKCMFVDYEKKRVLVRDVQSDEEQYMEYDLLIGCDGVRSVVREAMIKRHTDFQCEITDIFQEFKSTHVQLPENINLNAMSLMPDMFPHMAGIALPETGGQLNISVGVARNNFDKIAPELKSDDYKVVAEYVKKNFKGFELVDYEDFAKQWVGQRWNQTGMVHCNFYHSLKTNIILMGDAAHATSPSIGMGMNTALRDAQIFHEILRENKDDLSLVLPLYSEARVKEGNALSDLAFNLYCLDTTQQFKETMHMLIRGWFHKKMPRLVDEHPQAMIGRRGTQLSDVYDASVRQGIMTKHRQINDRIRQEYFEQLAGMTKPTKKSHKGKIAVGLTVIGIGLLFLL